MASQFRIDPNAYLGHNYASFRDKLFSLAIADPKKYFAIREEVVRKTKQNAVKQLYETIFDVMDQGTVDGNPIVTVPGLPAGFVFSPKVPPQKINEVSLSAAKTLDKILDDILEIVVPLDYKSIAAKRLAVTGEASAMSGSA